MRPAKESELEPLTVSVKTAMRLSSFGHSKINELIASRRLKSKKVDGKRLVIYASLKKLLDPGADAGNDRAA